ncbi:hypothetical protein HYN48_09360 [Flavobacterium magnum]|uniref:Uncharacterized protein n=1 Tax=Flavobacterium magnum TaxID=2162713 RepID=A0A2S0RET3_9FLAO|nr:hypothetical protein HYN48_09360 [Flavobacterium magnum]
MGKAYEANLRLSLLKGKVLSFYLTTVKLRWGRREIYPKSILASEEGLFFSKQWFRGAFN